MLIADCGLRNSEPWRPEFTRRGGPTEEGVNHEMSEKHERGCREPSVLALRSLPSALRKFRVFRVFRGDFRGQKIVAEAGIFEDDRRMANSTRCRGIRCSYAPNQER